MSLKSFHECKEAASAYGKTIKREIDAELAWCIFYNNEVYWGAKVYLWKPEAQEICSNDVKGIFI